MSLTMLSIKICGHETLLFMMQCLKATVHANPSHFSSNSANIYSLSTHCLFCVCTEKKLKNPVLVHSPGSVNGETKKWTWAGPHTNIATRQFQGVYSTWSQDRGTGGGTGLLVTVACQCMSMNLGGAASEGALCVYLICYWVQISTILLQE